MPRQLAGLALATAIACSPSPPPVPQTLHFTEVGANAGLDFHHFNGAQGAYYYVETFGPGAAFFDFDDDGWQDIYLVNGAPLDSSATDAPVNRLYRNTRDGRFRPVPGAADPGYGMGVAAADFDNDGDRDLYITNFGPNALYRNDGQGQFTAVTETWGGGDNRWGSSCAFLDYDGDGDIDLFAANYVDYALAENVLCHEHGVRAYCPPGRFEPVADLLYRNDGDRFTDVSAQTGITARGRGLGVALADYDGDGDTDIYVANDGTMNFLYRNDGDRFAEVSLETGTRFDQHGRPEAGMGVDFGDYDDDGRPDLFATNFAYETNTLYRNAAPGPFRNYTERLGLTSISFLPLGFGTKFHDGDNDGDLDLFVANGHVVDNIARFDSAQTYAQADQFLRNEEGRLFTDISAELGPDLTQRHPSRAAAVADYDNDGDQDLLVTTVAGPARLLRNDSTGPNHWLVIDLVGAAQRDALGTRVVLTTSVGQQTRECQSGGSYLASHDPRLHFGLGAAAVADLEIHWPNGQRQHLQQVAADQILRIQQPVAAATEPE